MRNKFIIANFVPIVIISLLFVIICYFYATQINLWGDETIAILRASSDIQEILITGDNHTPTYFLILKLFLPIIDNNILLLRLLHVLPFLLGLYLGYFTLTIIFPYSVTPLLTLFISIFLPNYIFYATNIRMYAPMFLASMAFITIISLILQQQKLNNLYLLILFLTSLALVASNYSSLIYYLPGLVFLLAQRYYKAFIVALFPGLLAFIWVLIFSFGDIQAILNWPVALSQGINREEFNLVSFAATIYLSIRPGLDLIYSAGLPVLIALGLPMILLLIYFSQLLRLGWQNKSNIPLQFILVNSWIWLLVAPTGYAFTRLFLPSHFFILAVLIEGIFTSKKWQKFIFSTILGLMLIVNIQEAINPTLRLYNLIPYEQIAKDMLLEAEVEEVKTILLSNNSLNTKSIEYYLKQNLSTNSEVNIIPLTPNLKLPKTPLVYISHLAENEQFTSVKTLEEDWQLSSQHLQKYIKIDNLPYNKVWKNRIIKRSQQPYAVETYLLK